MDFYYGWIYSCVNPVKYRVQISTNCGLVTRCWVTKHGQYWFVLPGDTKTLPESMLNYQKWVPVAGQLDRKCLRYCLWHKSKNPWFMVNDDFIKWKHFPRYWLLVRGVHWSPVNSPTQRPVTLMFSLICAGINGWVRLVRLVIWDIEPIMISL